MRKPSRELFSIRQYPSNDLWFVGFLRDFCRHENLHVAVTAAMLLQVRATMGEICLKSLKTCDLHFLMIFFFTRFLS